MIGPRFTRILAAGALATTLAGGMTTSSEAIPLPVTPVQGIAGAGPAEHVQWRRYGWGGYGWGGGRPNYGGALPAGALARGLPRVAKAPPAKSHFPFRFRVNFPSYWYNHPSY